MMSSGMNESSTSRDTDSVVRIKRNYAKFSATEAPYCITLLQCNSTTNTGNKTFGLQSRKAARSPSEQADAIHDTAAADIRQLSERPAETGRK